MLKVKVSQKTKLQMYQRQFEGEMISTYNEILYCRVCEKTFGCEKRFQVLQHLNTNIHKENIKIKSTKSAPVQKLHSEFSNNSFSQFSFDLCEAFLAADIPLWKLINPTLRNFIEKYTQCKVPDESTVRKNYVKQCYDLTIESIRDKIQDNFVWVSIDETQDCEGRFIANCIVGSLNKNKQSTPYLLAVVQFKTTNSSAVSGFFINSMNLLWPNGIQYERVLLFVTDAASYIMKAGTALKVIFPNMTHLTCLAHGLHRVAETIHANFPLVDKLVSSVKKVFVKAPYRKEAFKAVAPSVSLPPEPILTRWSTWLCEVSYYTEHLETVRNVVNTFDPESAASIQIAQEVLKNAELETNLSYISAHFSDLPSAISSLEASNSNTTLYQPLSLFKTSFQIEFCSWKCR
ncbi:hypothetical protein B7P43_G07511 [Cryptotermes secundus]|uniref:DUF659 domain-containing protein n=1 Tax=Cryptotermes secundus TaxID=105785 RepID=A0A2J7PSH8_9NEOP|nr:hypothetical protein B7P43_G07511 [Cryptotermes secundus]